MNALTRLSLRLRVFLFFALMGIGGPLIVVLSLYYASQRVEEIGQSGVAPLAGIMAAFGIALLVTGVWWLFDQNVARPIQSIASELRVAALTGKPTLSTEASAQYLGDLAPAAGTAVNKVAEASVSLQAELDRHTEKLCRDRDILMNVVSQLDVPVALLNDKGCVSMYNGAARTEFFAQRTSILGRPVGEVAQTESEPAPKTEAPFGIDKTDGRIIRPVASTGQEVNGFIYTKSNHEGAEQSADAEANLDLLFQSMDAVSQTLPLNQLPIVVFDTETTGLEPHGGDEIVQIAAVRIVAGRRVQSEIFNEFVNPGRPIPAAATAIHGVTDTMVEQAPPLSSVGQDFKFFAQGAVLVAHNAPFDMAFLNRFSVETGVPFDNPVLDTVLLSAILFEGNEDHTLDALAHRFDVSIPEEHRHTALGDAIATSEILLRMMPVLKSRNLDTLDTITEAAARHAALERQMKRRVGSSSAD